ncbi:hypothetical protein PRZ48_004865 [Zasmidium cellare]|uniref:Methyltransferase domain-containing protein n=1 Tax=Zasmidium cellare TaxID=395010 RepID=A0ABR0ERQ9_ZASCE|nr:hypothetical protein PRZ48_004865 [Zasmidium cellare]
MVKSSNDIYALPRDTKETQRLNEQHKHLLKCFSFLIHPGIPITPSTPDLRVADIACGSGIWLTDAAQRYPNAECHGFDISGDQFPDEASLDKLFGPGRVRFHVEDAGSEAGPLPEHQPGGHVQWIDWDPKRAYVVQYKPLAKKAAMEQLASGFRECAATRDTSVAERLDELLSEHGVTDVLAEKFCSDPNMETRDFLTWTVLGSAPSMVRNSLIGKDGSGWSEERLARLEKEAKEERAAGEAFLRFDMTCYIAKKPE